MKKNWLLLLLGSLVIFTCLFLQTDEREKNNSGIVSKQIKVEKSNKPRSPWQPEDTKEYYFLEFNPSQDLLFEAIAPTKFRFVNSKKTTLTTKKIVEKNGVTYWKFTLTIDGKKHKTERTYWIMLRKKKAIKFNGQDVEVKIVLSAKVSGKWINIYVK